MKLLLALLLPTAFLLTLAADDVRPIPPPGIEIPAADRAEIEAGVKKLGEEIAKLHEMAKTSSLVRRQLPNVEIFHKSADWAVRYGEMFEQKHIAIAKEHILQGLERAAALAKGQTPWNTATGLVARGYRSSIDGSVQPYGVLVPESVHGITPESTREAGRVGMNDPRVPLHFWCHGRGEKLSELAFINGVQSNKGEFTPEGAIVCYLYGRYCCANKFAGEVDLFEALNDIKVHYPIDEQRLVIRGFSMGGAAAWQFAFHHPGRWAAAAPGAGFAETEEFFGRTLYAEGATPPPWWERQLWRWYDVTICARNVAGLPLVAYSGENDGQKQSADIMLRYAAQEKHSFTHIIGPNVPHKYHPDAKPVIEKFVEVALGHGNDPGPKSVSYTTYSLIYPSRAWARIEGMEKSWERADVDATIEKDTLTVKTKNVSALILAPRPPWGGGTMGIPASVFPDKARLVIDGTEIPMLGGAIGVHKRDGKWQSGSAPYSDLRKKPTLCGPIDHAFMSHFVFVRPTGKPLNEAVGKWTQSEMEHAIKSWRAVFRGDVEVIDDTEWLERHEKLYQDKTGVYQGAEMNSVLWGDVSSNKAIAKIADKLPIAWGKDGLNFKTYRLDPARYVPVLIYPNPLHRGHYVVLNSGHTFREFALLNNSDQTPKLPDWAIVDISKPADAKWPGLIFDAGFFDEHWK